MKANELRLGNLVSSYDLLSEITSVNNEGCFIQIIDHTDEHDYTQDVSNNFICPIPLTEEWLLRFGFEKGKFEKWHGNGFDYKPVDVYTERYRFTMLNTEFEYHLSNWFYKGNIDNQDTAVWYGNDLIKCDYVHQLQNLYFALTGEELTLKSEL